jgi:hypothetical protein
MTFTTVATPLAIDANRPTVTAVLSTRRFRNLLFDPTGLHGWLFASLELKRRGSSIPEKHATYCKDDEDVNRKPVQGSVQGSYDDACNSCPNVDASDIDPTRGSLADGNGHHARFSHLPYVVFRLRRGLNMLDVRGAI